MTNPLWDDYVRKRRQYHEAGKAAKGSAPGSAERVRYVEAKAAYQEAGRRLRESRAA